MFNFLHKIISAIGTAIVSVGLLFTGTHISTKIPNTPLVSTSTSQVEVVSTSTIVNTGSITKPSPVQTPTIVQPLIVSCSADMANASPGQTIIWTAQTSGGNGSHSYTWAGDGGLSSTNQSPTISWSYNSTGIMNARVSVTSGTQTVNANCKNSVIVTQVESAQNNNQNQVQAQTNSQEQAIQSVITAYTQKEGSIQQEIDDVQGQMQESQNNNCSNNIGEGEGALECTASAEEITANESYVSNLQTQNGILQKVQVELQNDISQEVSLTQDQIDSYMQNITILGQIDTLEQQITALKIKSIGEIMGYETSGGTEAVAEGEANLITTQENAQIDSLNSQIQVLAAELVQ